MHQDTFEIAVVGAGIHGLCVAHALARRGVRRIVVLDRFPAGHARGSSHGSSRITRSSYHDPLYVRLAGRARRDDWPALAQDLGFAPIVDTPGLFFGPDSPRLRAFADATLGACRDVARIAVAEARKRFPMFTFAGTDLVLLDSTAGVIRADAVLAGLRRWLVTAGVEVRHGVGVQGWRRVGGRLEVKTDAGVLSAARVVLTAGAWIGNLVPSLASRFTVVRQHIAYLRLDAEAAAMCAPAFPVWASIGATPDEFFYGLPDGGEGGVKVARHVVTGRGDDPAVASTPDATALATAEAFARRTFLPAVLARVHAETCLYTSTTDEHFVVAALPDEPAVVVVSACSGHGFKFGPTIGAVVAAAIVDGAALPEAFAV